MNFRGIDNSISRVQPIDREEYNEGRDEGKRRRRLFQGREWSEADEEDQLTVQTSIPKLPRPSKPRSVGIYANEKHVEDARKLFAGLTTLEEKVAQLFVLETRSIYDAALQHEVELIIQTWQIGGIFFREGNYKRQAYLIERFQELSKTPLLIANDFLHGLSFYLQGDPLPKGPISQQHFCDLGKAIMAQNRRIGVHVQFDRERYLKTIPMTEEQAIAFRKGIRHAHGIVGKEKGDRNSIPNVKSFSSVENKTPTPAEMIEAEIQETVGFKTVTLFDGSNRGNDLVDTIYEAFEAGYDLFMLGVNLPSGIRALCKLIRSGRIREEELDRRILKNLIIKSHCTNGSV